VIFDVRVIALDPGNAANIETLMKDKTGLDRLIGEGRARIEASLIVRARVNEQAQARIGERIPVQIASVPALPANPNDGGQVRQPLTAYPQIQYENTGLSLEIAPLRLIGDQLEARVKLELSGVDHGSSLTPSFVTRNLSDIIQVRVGEPTVLLGVAQPGQRAAAAGGTGPSQSSFAVLLTARLSN